MSLLIHLPTVLLAIGYPVFWLELWWGPHPDGRTTWLATSLALLTSCGIIIRGWPKLQGCAHDFWHEWRMLPAWNRWLIGAGGGMVIGLLTLSGYASFLPPHLQQELDAINYHFTLPRQHLIRGSFVHLPWSSADLWPLPIQFALAPYWFATALPTKWPQWVFVLGLLGVVARLSYSITIQPRHRIPAACLAVFAVVGSHGISVQFGTAMLDLVVCYLFLATLDSWLSHRWGWAALELTFITWCKSFQPLVLGSLGVGIAGLMWMAIRMRLSVGWGLGHPRPIPWQGISKMLFAALIFSTVLGGPFIAKSLYYAGTPLYPLWAGAFPILAPMTQERKEAIQQTAQELVKLKDAYGYGRSVRAFMKHLWDIAVPEGSAERRVTNAFDYPLGLPYLLFLGPFVVFVLQQLSRRSVGLIPFCVVWLWLMWWMSSQQSRWLYIPLTLMFVTCSTLPVMGRSLGLWSALLLSLVVTGISMVRTHRNDFGKPAWQVLRQQDRALIEYAKTLPVPIRAPIPWPNKEVAFATFPVTVTKPDRHWVFPQPSNVVTQ